MEKGLEENTQRDATLSSANIFKAIKTKGFFLMVMQHAWTEIIYGKLRRTIPSINRRIILDQILVD